MSFPHLIKWVEMAARAHIDRTLKDMPVSSAQLFALILLRERGKATAAELARLMHQTPQAMTTLLGPLHEQQLIERRADAAHGRRILLRLTPQAAALLQNIHARSPAIEAELLAELAPEERDMLKSLLSRVARRFG